MSIFYKSVRVGKHGKKFQMYKLRTMVEGADRIGPPSTSGDDTRITKAGQFLRKYKLDELPQLWNVIRGDMALVGPRPEVPEVVKLMTTREQCVILSVKPGITDLASLWNYNEEERLAGAKDPHTTYLKEIWPEKKRLQIEYVEKKSAWLDFKILIWTIKKLLIR